MQKIRKGDVVQVIAGADKGQRGKVLDVYSAEGKIRVEGVRVQKRHLKPGKSQKMPSGGVIDKPGRVDISNVKLYSDKLGCPVRVGFKTREDGTKVRVARGKRGEETELD